MKTSTKHNLKSGMGWTPALLMAAALLLSGAPPLRADNDRRDSDRSLDSGLLNTILQDTYWRSAFGDANVILPKDQNNNAVVGGIALLARPNTPGDGTPGSIDITLKAGQRFFLPLIAWLGANYTNGTPPDPFLDDRLFGERNLQLKLRLDGDTILDEDDAEEFYSKRTFDPPVHPTLFAPPVDSMIFFQGISVVHGPLSPGKHVLKLDVKMPVPGLANPLEYHNTFNITVQPKPGRVVPPNQRYHGRTYAEWSAKLWEWYLEIPVDDPNHPHPQFAEDYDVAAFQKFDDVWFVTGAASEITMTVPSDKALIFWPVAAEASSLETPPYFGITQAEQRAAARFYVDHSSNVFCTIDGVPVGPVSAYRVSSPQFRFDAPTPWIFGDVGGRGTATADGYYFLVEPLSKGEHTVRIGGEFHAAAGEFPDFGPDPVDLSFETIYHVKVR